MQFIYEGKSNLDNEVLTIRANLSPLKLEKSDRINMLSTQCWLPLESIEVGDFKWDHNILIQWCLLFEPLELMIVDDSNNNNLIKKLLTILSHVIHWKESLERHSGDYH